jgi:hypothetical protein
MPEVVCSALITETVARICEPTGTGEENHTALSP